MKSMGNLGKDYLVSVPLADEDAVLPICLCRREDDAREETKEFFSLVRGLRADESRSKKGRTGD